jgi:hypothetical protein
LLDDINARHPEDEDQIKVLRMLRAEINERIAELGGDLTAFDEEDEDDKLWDDDLEDE